MNEYGVLISDVKSVIELIQKLTIPASKENAIIIVGCLNTLYSVTEELEKLASADKEENQNAQ